MGSSLSGSVDAGMLVGVVDALVPASVVGAGVEVSNGAVEVAPAPETLFMQAAKAAAKVRGNARAWSR
jgi:hypothetical protein